MCSNVSECNYIDGNTTFNLFLATVWQYSKYITKVWNFLWLIEF